MCVIAFSPKGVDIPTPEQIKQMWKANPDGAGYAFVGKRGKVFYRKGFMYLDDLLKELEHPEKFKNTNFAIHFRIGTSGKNDCHTCHPFPVSNNFGELRKISGQADSVLFHNGVIGKGGLASPLSSDTQDFVIAMCPMLQKFNRSVTRDNLIEEIVEGNRVLVLYKNNAVKMYGKWEKDGDIWVSNLNYKWYSSYHGGSYYGYYWDDEYSWESRLTPTKANEYGQRGETNKEITETEEDKAERLEAEHMIADIISKGYMFMDVPTFNKVKKYADGVRGDTIEYAGFVFEYDEEQELIWLEEDTYGYLEESSVGVEPSTTE